jgi:hypothetical protein
LDEECGTLREHIEQRVAERTEQLAHPRFPGELRTPRVAWIVVCCLFVYAVVFFALRRDESFREETFATAPALTVPVNLYIDELSFDPVRQAIEMRFDLASGSTVRGVRYGGPLNRDIELSIGDGDSEQIVVFHRNGATSTHTVSLDLHGAIAAYPFDRYRSDITLLVRDLYAPAGMLIPIRATVWEGVSGWVSGIRASPVPASGGLTLALTVRRPLPIVSLTVILYSLMVVVAVCSLCIGGLVFVGARKVESTILGALVAMVFSITVLRNVLPGTPPIGVTADIIIFLWVEVAVIAGLSLVVTAWVKRGPGA